MANREQLYTALRNAHAAGDVEGAKKLATYIQAMPAEPSVMDAPAKPAPTVMDEVKQAAIDIPAGLVRGAGSIGATLLAPIDIAKDAMEGKGLTLESNRQRRKDIDGGLKALGANPDSIPYTVGKLGGEVAGTLGVGTALGAGAKAVGAAPSIVNALTTSGMKAGTTPGAVNFLARILGGAATGGAAAGLIDPEHAGTGAVIGGALPPAMMAAGKTLGYAGKTAGSLIKPFTASGQDDLADGIIRKFAEGGPKTVNANQLVQNSSPTLAEATGNAGVATLQRTARDLRPNAFVERELNNAAARVSAFDDIAGTPARMKDLAAERAQVADALYGKAFAADKMRVDLAKSAQATRAPFASVGLSGARDDLATPGLRELAKRPAFQSAIKDAKVLAQNGGLDIGDPTQSLQGLHYIKLALDDALNPTAKSTMGRNTSGKIMEMRDKLADELAQISPLYGNARDVFAEMSAPINAMETLQGLRLVDAKGNITLSKIQTAIADLTKKQAEKGVNGAKSVLPEQMNTLKAIRDDLLRQAELGGGKSVGSNTFQNIATDNILNSLGGNWLSRLADRTGVSGVVGQVGKLVYSNPNEAIRNRLVDKMLQPNAAVNALASPQVKQNALAKLLSNPDVQQPIFRSAPALSSSR